MARPRLTEEERRAMRERILDAAEAIARKGGPRTVTSRAIAEEMGTSHMVLYTYFESLDEVFQAMQLRRVERLAGYLEELKARAREQGADIALRGALMEAMKHIRNHPRMADLPIMMASNHNRHARGKGCKRAAAGPGVFWRTMRHDIVVWGREMITIGQEQGCFQVGDPQDMAETAMALLSGLLVAWRVGLVSTDRVNDVYAISLDVVMGYLKHGIQEAKEPYSKEDCDGSTQREME